MYRARLGFLDERAPLDESLTIEHNIALPLDLHGVERAQRDRAVADLVKRLRLGVAANRLPKHVSRGERQLAAFARAIVAGPAIALLDEPFQGLSDETAGIAATLLQNMCAKGMTAIIVSAEERTAAFFHAPRLARMHRGRLTEASAPIVTSDRVREVASVAMTELVEHSTDASEEAPVIIEKKKETTEKTGEKKKVRITSVGSL
jgi:ABC-type multidrug transport system ATPase subunit